MILFKILELHDAVFVVGALEETIVLRGMRYHPIDIENTVMRCHQKIAESYVSFIYSIKILCIIKTLFYSLAPCLLGQTFWSWWLNWKEPSLRRSTWCLSSHRLCLKNINSSSVLLWLLTLASCPLTLGARSSVCICAMAS